MNTPVSLDVGQGKSGALIITHTIRAGEEKRYESWLTEILDAVSSSPGYLGREIFRPAQGTRTYTSIIRFDGNDNLNAWVESDVRRAFVSQVADLLEKGDRHEIRTGIDFWFTPQGVRPPKPWKQFILTLSAVYPLSLIIPRLFSMLFPIVPVLALPIISGLLVASSLTALLTFVIMPRYTRLLKWWLYDETG
ncbi:MAG: antibiotic biosynthesis monooxygenase [Desulfuromonadales bacterium]|nr:antibiotic biosynthesis monooxygenase [Desulfuromonadales bacterium]